MKRRLILLMLFIITSVKAQDLRLFDNDWHLSKVVKNGIDHLPPYNTGGLSFTAQESSILAYGCLSMFATIEFEQNTTGFTLNEFSPCLCTCPNPSGEAYDNLYFGFFGLFSNESADFTYIITEAGDVKTLTIYSMFNEQVIYSSEAMSVTDEAKVEVGFYPNPAANFIYISVVQELVSAQIKIYNEMGKLCKSTNMNSPDLKFDVSDLPAGLYFLTASAGEISTTKKLLKQ